MAVAFVSEFDVEPGDRSTPVYDAVNQRLGVADDPPAGLVLHTAGFAGDVFRVFDVWETQADAQRFYDELLTPLVKQVQEEQGLEGGPPARQYAYELIDVLKP